MYPFRPRNPDSPKTPPASPPRKRVLFRTPSAGERNNTADSTAAEESPPTMATVATTPPASPTRRQTPLGIANVANIFIKMRRASSEQAAKPWHIDSCSGEEPQTHAGIVEAATSPTREPLRQTDTYICEGGVNVAQLLRATRNALMDEAEAMGATVLVDERWKSSICGPKNRPNGTFKVEITYTASAMRSDCPDPHRPVALDKVKGVPGLMTVIKRLTE